MTTLARAHKTGRYHGSAIELAAVVEAELGNEPARVLALGRARLLVHDEPFRETPDADTLLGLAGIVRVGRRCVESRRRDAGHYLKLARQSRFDDLLEILRPGPGLEAPHDHRVTRQIEQRSGAPGGDDLAAANLAVRLAAH